jgi:hypothetical protein
VLWGASIRVQKVRDLLAKIAYPKLESAKQAIRINSVYKNDLSMVVNFLAESVKVVDRAKTRTIAHLTQNNTNTSGNHSWNRQGGRYTTFISKLHGG